MKLIACFLFCAFSFSLINTTPIKEAVMCDELITTIEILNKIMEVVSIISIFFIINYL